MSEFSHSFHLRATDLQEAIALLRRAKAPGYAFPPGNGFVTFVCPGDHEVHEAVLAANQGLLVEYSFAEDHRCSVDVYDSEKNVASLSVDFENARARFERSKFLALGLLDARTAEDVSRWIRGSPDAESRRGNAAHVIARSLRLPRFAWLSYRYAQSDDDPPDGRIEVDRSGRARTVEMTATEEIDELLATLPPTHKPTGDKPRGAKKRKS
jgi:hypothetical protein